MFSIQTIRRAAIFISCAVATQLAVPANAKLSQDATVSDVIQCVRGNVPEQVGIRKINIISTGRDGQSTEFTGRVYATREANSDGERQMRAMLKIDSPPSLAGAAYLVRETDDFLRDAMFVYLPAVDRVRRISGKFGDASLLGTDFSYYDFKQLSGAFGDLNATLEGRAAIEGRPAFAINFKPIEGSETRYTGVRAWIDSATCLTVKAEFLEGDDIVKVLSAPASAISKTNDIWFLGEINMLDKQNGTQTKLTVDQITLDENLSGSRFDSRSFYRVP